MNILVLTHKTPYPPTDGGSIATLNMITGLSEAGAEVDVLCMQTPKHNSGAESIPDELKKNINWESVFIDTNIKPLNAIKNLLFSKLPYNAERFISEEFSGKLKKLLQSKKYDIVQLEGLYLTPYIKTIKSVSDSKIVMRSHNLEHKIWERMAAKETNPLKAFYKNILKKRVYKMEVDSLHLFDILIPISPVDTEFFKKYYTGKIKVSCTGMPDKKFKKGGSENNSSSLFFLGALDWEPNREGLIWFCKEVWPYIIEENKNLSLKIAGRNAPDGFEDKVASENISFIGEVRSADDFIDSNGIMIAPLFSGSGIRIKIIEGMARSKCIITTSTGAEGINATHKKNIIICNDAKSMAKEVLYLTNNCDIVSQIEGEAFSFANEFYNNSNTTRELFEYYKNTLK